MASTQPDPQDQPKKKRWYQLSKREVEARLAQRQQRAQQRYEQTPKPSVEAIRERVEQRDAAKAQRKAERAAEAEANPHRQVARLNAVVGGAGLVAAVALGGLITVSQQHEHDRVAEYQQQAQAIQQDIDELTPAGVDGSVALDEHQTAEVVEVIQEDRTAAETMAEDVAVAQQAFAELYYASNDETAPAEGLAKPSAEAAAEHRVTLGEFFVEDTFRASDSDVQIATPAPPFSATELDPRWPWYLQMDDDGLFVDPDTYQWSVDSVMPVAGSGQQLQVLWTNRDTQTDEVYAWAIGLFEPAEAAFIAVEVGMTGDGSRRGSVSGSPATPDSMTSDHPAQQELSDQEDDG